jgi:1-deoxy-D-xylulose-5-phosphate synthase
MGAGHASTSIGYGVGLKEAMRRGIGEDGKVVAVIGDGALTGGVAYEASQQAGGLETPMVIVLNDNGMSISPNVGALSHYFNRFRLNPRLFHAREDVEERLTKLPLGLGRRIERLGPEIKSAIKAYWARDCSSRSSASPISASSTDTTSPTCAGRSGRRSRRSDRSSSTSIPSRARASPR